MSEVQTVGARLERDRLQLRATRIERVLLALKDRSVFHHDTPGLERERAIADFGEELGRLRRRLDELPR